MRKFLEEKITSFSGRLTLIFGAFGLSLVISSLFLLFFKTFETPFDTETIRSMFSFHIGPHFVYTFFSYCIAAPLWEELAFRIAPIKLATAFGKYFGPDLGYNLLIPVVILSSTIFGWGHGGEDNIWIQGIGGVILSIVYIKTNYHYWSNVALHFLTNLSAAFVLPALFGK